ncbi:hypothetical protein FHT98_4745 [Bosea sp. AK1]|uniref:hypothetical protein n=1 Tax=Bosea sp. AK1 TaxID=2587160 RepID=UPI001152FE4D|nr:hypothetical protein [Bosea sp. AK1]TQI76943.1 hypothetical protein FHT98_4745 [Bosea sp. AK1]
MSVTTILWQIPLALAGCFGGAYLGQEILGGGAIGWSVTGAIVALCCAPLFKSLMAHRARRQSR